MFIMHNSANFSKNLYISFQNQVQLSKTEFNQLTVCS